MENPSGQISGKHSFRLRKQERLCSQKLIETLFAEGKSFLVYPFKVVYVPVAFEGQHPAQVAFAVSKKLYRKAVQRNAIKRRMREAYRLNKHVLLSDVEPSKKAVMFIYVGKEMLSFQIMEKAMIRALGMLK